MANENDYMGKEYLMAKLQNKKSRIDTRYNYYDMKKIPKALLSSTPAELQLLMPAFGWCATAVDAIADRMTFNGFDEDTDDFGINDLYLNNNQDILFDSVIQDALISSCSFVYVYVDPETAEVKMHPIMAKKATGVMDVTTGFLKEGYAVLETAAINFDENSEYGAVKVDAYFTPEYTEIHTPDGTDTIPNPTGIPLLIPVVHKPDSDRQFGHSIISRACMNIQDHAARIFLDSCIASGVGALPQKYITGLADDVEIDDKFKAAVTRMLTLYRDEDGNVPQVGQFAQINITPYMDAMRLQASTFAGHTGLTVDDLGFVSANPTSVEALRASHERLKRKAKKAQRTVSVGLKNAGFVAACLRDETQYDRSQIRYLEPLWEPIDEVDPSTMSIIGDGAIKLNQAVEGFVTKKNLSKMTGIKSEDNA